MNTYDRIVIEQARDSITVRTGEIATAAAKIEALASRVEFSNAAAMRLSLHEINRRVMKIAQLTATIEDTYLRSENAKFMEGVDDPTDPYGRPRWSKDPGEDT